MTAYDRMFYALIHDGNFAPALFSDEKSARRYVEKYGIEYLNPRVTSVRVTELADDAEPPEQIEISEDGLYPDDFQPSPYQIPYGTDISYLDHPALD